MKRIVRAALFVVAASFTATLDSAPAAADAVADFYKGREVRIIIGVSMGGSYGLFAQIAAQHIGRHLPGNPTVVPQEMPGAGGNVSLNYMQNAAPQDGTVVTVPMQAIVHETLLNPAVRFNAKEFHWFGRFVDIALVATAAKRSGITSIEDTMKKEYVVGGAGPRNPTSVAPLALNMMAGTRFKVVSGYSGTGAAYVALEQGEVDIASTSWLTLHSLHAHKMQAGELIPIFVIGAKRVPDIPDVPALPEFGKTDAHKAFLSIYSVQGEIGRSMAGPPRMPKERIEAWRKAFATMIADPEFRADAAKRKLDLNSLDGPSMQAIIDEVMGFSPETVKQAADIYAELLPSTRPAN